jgi:crotonobetainyl-CoA:carnitine CoA-transferase CaiB-like acyl-CoA transferase
VQNWRPGVAEKLGVGYDDLRRDDLVYVSISGFGNEGPYAHKGAYDTVIQAYGGIGWSQGGTGEPEFVRQVLADKVTALSASQAITAALLARERGLGGQHVHLSMLDAVVSFLWIDGAGNDTLLDGDGSQPASFSAGARPFRFQDGWAVATPTANSDFFGMCKAFGVDGWDDPRVASPTLRQQNPDVSRALNERCHEAATTMTVAEGMARMEAERVPCGIVYDPAALADDAHAQAIGLLVDDVHPLAGRIRQPRHPVLFDDTPATVGGPAPAIGADTDAVLRELGLADRTAALRQAGIVA